MSTLREIWILPINSTKWHHNDAILLHCVNQVMPISWKWWVHYCVILVAVGWAVFKLYRERPFKINSLIIVNGTEMPFKLRLKLLSHCQEDYAVHCFWKSMFQVRWSPSNHFPTLAVRCMKTLLFLLYYAALLSLSAHQVKPVELKAWSV